MEKLFYFLFEIIFYKIDDDSEDDEAEWNN